jgi:hypothetical protein
MKKKLERGIPVLSDKDMPWTQTHTCKVCGAEWECGFRLCLEPLLTECCRCKCGPIICGWRI